MAESFQSLCDHIHSFIHSSSPFIHHHWYLIASKPNYCDYVSVNMGQIPFLVSVLIDQINSLIEVSGSCGTPYNYLKKLQSVLHSVSSYIHSHHSLDPYLQQSCHLIWLMTSILTG